MWRRLTVLTVTLCFLVSAATSLTIQQLISFVSSSIELRHDDRRVADYLRNVELQNKLDDLTIQELEKLGAGPRTLEALWKLREVSKNLPEEPSLTQKPAPPGIAPPDPAEQKRIIKEVRDYALSYSKALPNFICTQVTRRYIDPSGLEFWRSLDVLTTRLTFFEEKEEYQLILINGRPTDRPFQSAGGTTSTGEFGSMLREVFSQETETEFQWKRWATLRGRRTHVFGYRVRQSHSRWRIEYENTQRIVTGYTGLAYVDRDTLMIMRLTLEAENIPVTFPIQEATTVLDYDFVKIGETEHVLPLRADVRLRHDRTLTKNEVEFRMYRRFSAEATLSFDTPDPLSEDQLEEQPPVP